MITRGLKVTNVNFSKPLGAKREQVRSSPYPRAVNLHGEARDCGPCGRVNSILDWAKVRGYRAGKNAARWRGHLDKLLLARSKVQRVAVAPHHFFT